MIEGGVWVWVWVWGVPAACRLPRSAAVPGAPVRISDMDNREPRSKYTVLLQALRVACCVLLYLSVFSAHDNGRGRAAYAPPLTPLLSLWLSLLITELGYLNFADDTSGE